MGLLHTIEYIIREKLWKKEMEIIDEYGQSVGTITKKNLSGIIRFVIYDSSKRAVCKITKKLTNRGWSYYVQMVEKNRLYIGREQRHPYRFVYMCDKQTGIIYKAVSNSTGLVFVIKDPDRSIALVKRQHYNIVDDPIGKTSIVSIIEPVEDKFQLLAYALIIHDMEKIKQ